MKAIDLAKKIANLAGEVKALDPVILNLEGISSFTDFFVICSASSDRQTRAIADKVEIELKKENIRPSSVEGYEQASWIVLDYFDVVLHVFLDDLRQEYDLESFWQKAKKVKATPAKKTARSKSTPVKGSSRKKAPVRKTTSSVSKKTSSKKKI